MQYLDGESRDIENDFGDIHTYHTTPIPPGEGFDLIPPILKLLGEPLGKLGEAFSGEGDVNVASFGYVLDSLSQNIISVGGSKFIKKLLKYTTREDENGKLIKVSGPSFDTFYARNYGELMQAVYFALEYNYGPIIKKNLESIGSNLMHLFESLVPESTPATSTTSTGD